MLENQQHENINDLDEHFALNLMPDDELQNSCSPIWMYNIGEAFADISAAGQLPNGKFRYQRLKAGNFIIKTKVSSLSNFSKLRQLLKL